MCLVAKLFRVCKGKGKLNRPTKATTVLFCAMSVFLKKTVLAKISPHFRLVTTKCRAGHPFEVDPRKKASQDIAIIEVLNC
jgi:hypothetical protein